MNVPTGYTALDLVGFTDKGVYNSSTDYVQNDIVHYGGDMWRCLIDDTQGITPTEGANWTLWIGEPTNMTEAIIAPLENSPATAAHTVGDQLIYNDTLYKVIAAIAVGDALTVGTNIQAARKIVYQISATESIIAGIEYTTTASQAYSAGDYLLYDWTLYKVTASIASGGSIITTGGSANVSATTIGAEISSLNSHIANLETADSNIKATMRSNGAHNLLPQLSLAAIKADSKNNNGSWTGNNVYTYNGITFTYDESDYSVTINGTSTGDAPFYLVKAQSADFWNGKVLSGNPDSNMLLRLQQSASPWTDFVDQSGGTEVTISGVTDSAWLMIAIIGAGKTINNVKVYPMIRSASDTDTTYAPYAMSNRELTKKFYTYSATVPAAGSSISLSLPYGTRDEWIISGVTLEYSNWSVAYSEYHAVAVFGVTVNLHTQYLEIGNGFVSGTYSKDAAGQNIRVLLVHM